MGQCTMEKTPPARRLFFSLPQLGIRLRHSISEAGWVNIFRCVSGRSHGKKQLRGLPEEREVDS